MKNLLKEIKEKEKDIKKYSEEELLSKIELVKKNKNKNNSLITDWFALVQEVSFRELGLRHFDTQLLGGLFLNEGTVVEMKTGEGKTLVSTLPISYNALDKRGTHVVTVNEYLAERDQKWMGKIYKKLTLSCGLVKNKQSLYQKKKNYNCDITYVTNSELVFDYLKDSCTYRKEEIRQRPLSFCLVDEIDSILIDEARTPLILSDETERENIHKLYIAKEITENLQKNIDFEIDEKRRDISLTEKGYNYLKEKLGKTTLYDPNDPWINILLNALKAEYLYKQDKDYMVSENQIRIIDEFSGRIMEDRRWGMGLHDAVEIKENVSLGKPTKTKASITYPNFFKLYPKLSGMTGTAQTNEKEFKDIYNLEVIVLPTHQTVIRKDLPDLIYQKDLNKWKAVLKQAKECFKIGQPILIGTSSIEKSEFLSELFKESKIPHQLLNARPENVNRESEIVAQAGKLHAVTIATNMAGRGTDIILGGNINFEVKQELLKLLLDKENNSNKNTYNFEINKIFNEYKENRTLLEENLKGLPYSLEDAKDSLKQLYNLLKTIKLINWKKDNLAVKNLGGLFVLGTERHETRRIDDQLRGRAGRQGDPGVSQFYISLDDDLINIFGGNRIKTIVAKIIDNPDLPLESKFLTTSIEKAQKKVESYNYEVRKNLLEYDKIINIQRNQLYKIRNEILFLKNPAKTILRLNEFYIDKNLYNYSKSLLNRKLEALFESYCNYFLFKNKRKSKKTSYYKELLISQDLKIGQANFYKLNYFANQNYKFLLEFIDEYWRQHIERMTFVKDTINLRAYGQENPLLEYNEEAIEAFNYMLIEIRLCMLYYFINNKFL
jgi:preprotein translocase subunit SecA